MTQSLSYKHMHQLTHCKKFHLNKTSCSVSIDACVYMKVIVSFHFLSSCVSILQCQQMCPDTWSGSRQQRVVSGSASFIPGLHLSLVIRTVIIMVDLPKYLRSKSQKLLGAIETVLNLPVALERQLNVDNNLNGSTARALVRRRSSRREEENEYESKFTGNSNKIILK